MRENEDITDRLIEMLQERRRLGIQRYGRGLTINDGTDSLLMALEEALDLVQYLTKLYLEREEGL